LIGDPVTRHHRAVPPPPSAAPVARIAARGRAFEDPACAGCAHLALLRALRRAGLAADGGLGCEPMGVAPGSPAAGAVLLAGAAPALRDPARLLASARPGRLLVVADRGGLARARAVERALAGSGARVERLDGSPSAAAAERAVSTAGAAPAPAAIVALAPCAALAPRRPPLAIAPERCSRCGACLGLGCVAISDPGGEALVIDAARCSGCERCATLCRGRAIRPLAAR
jgi:TPP-dependent indolepyruvate ferredoxin oxidoreductase alpha subunit